MGEHFRSMPLDDFSKLRIGNGIIRYRLYAQDGSMVDMSCADTLDNRLFVSWVQKFDRHTVAGKGPATNTEDSGQGKAADGASTP